MKISAVIPLYKAEDYIVETLDSIMKQTYPVEEVLVIDDCGSDRSAEIVEQYSLVHPIVKLIHQPYNQGGSAARNRGMQEAQYDWILLVDADDLLDPTLVEKQVHRLDGQLSGIREKGIVRSVSAVHSAYVQIDSDSQIVPDSEIRGEQLSYQDLLGSLIVRNFIITPTGMLVNKSVMQEIGGFRTDLKISEDFDFYLRLARAGNVLYIDEPLVKHRRHLTNVTENLGKSLVAGQTIIRLYPDAEIKDAILRRSYSETKNKLDLAKVQFYLEQYEHGYETLLSIEHDEAPVSSLFMKSIYAIKQDNLQLAHTFLEQLIELDCNHIASLNNIAVIKAKQGQIEGARELLQKCLTDMPGYLDAKHNLSILEDDSPSKDYKYTLRELRTNLLRYTSL